MAPPRRPSRASIQPERAFDLDRQGSSVNTTQLPLGSINLGRSDYTTAKGATRGCETLR